MLARVFHEDAPPVPYTLGNEPDSVVTISNVSYFTSGDFSRVVLETDGALQYSAHSLTHPDRLYFDLPGARLSRLSFKEIQVNGPILRVIRLGQRDPDTVRLVLGVQGRRGYRVTNDGNRLVVDIQPNAPLEGAEDAGNLMDPMPVDVSIPPPKPVFTIVVDPGHGGKDSGATGRGGLLEKEITLDIARRIERKLVRWKDIRVILTRKDDTFVPLGSRAERANAESADLFVSVHVNAARDRELRGVETWFLNATTNREWQQVADRENAFGGGTVEGLSELELIFQDLSRSYKMEESMSLAHRLQSFLVDEVKQDEPALHDHGVKWAKFQVLVGAQMPAALVEVGFISNRAEEKRLTAATYRDLLAEGISSGILDYIRSVRVADVQTAGGRKATHY